MKAKIYYRRPDPTLPRNKWKYTVKTIEVSKNEPNHILQEFIKITRLPQYTYVTHIKCGRYDYQWYDSCNGAFGVGIFQTEYCGIRRESFLDSPFSIFQ